MAVTSGYRPYTTPNKSVRSVTITSFHGIDLTSAPENVDLSRSPDELDMIPGRKGYPVARPQHKLITTFPNASKVHGVFKTILDGAECTVIHAGTSLYKLANDTCTRLSVTAADGSTVSFNDSDSTGEYMAFNGRPTLWIFTGEDYWYLRNKVDENGDIISGSYELDEVTGIATVPIISIGKAPLKDGAATSYAPVNLLINKQWEYFTVPNRVYLADGTTEDPNYALQNAQANAKDFYVSITPMIEAEAVVVKQMTSVDSTGETQWRTLTRVTGTPADGQFSVSLSTGLIHLGFAPGPSPITGESNIRVFYKSQRGPQSFKVRNCRFCTLYGVGGQPDRIFASGNEDEPNVDRWSEYGDPTYFGDTSYSVLGSDKSPIMGYSVLNRHLVTHKRDEDNGRNAYVRYGTLNSDGEAVFSITNVVQGEGAATSKGFASVNSEPLFITKRGVYAVTSSDLSGEKYNALRSHYITGAIIKHDMSSACGCMWGPFYVLGAGGRLYFLDTNNKSYERDAGTSSYQFDCWMWSPPGLSVKNVWVDDGYLYICMKDTNMELILKYKERWNELGDTARAAGDFGIDAKWTTPVLTLGSLSHKATVRDVTVQLHPVDATVCGMSYKNGLAAGTDVMKQKITAGSLPQTMRCTRKVVDVTSFQLDIHSTESSAGAGDGYGRFGLLGIEILYHNGIKVQAGG